MRQEKILIRLRQLIQGIAKAHLYCFDPPPPPPPLKPHFYTVFGGLQEYTIIFLFLLKYIDCGYSLEPPRRGGSNEYPQSMFWAEIWKLQNFSSESLHFFVVEF